MKTTNEITTKGIIFGVGAPNNSKKNGKSMCAIILTKELGFIRVYPIPAEARFPVWGNIEMVVAKGSDPRAESYNLISFKVTGLITDSYAKREILDAACIKTGMDDPMRYQNERKKSIFLVKPTWGDLEASITQKTPDIPRDDDECGWIVTQGAHWHKIYLHWTSDQGGKHQSHLGGREIYEGIRQNPHMPTRVIENIQVMNPDYEHWMLMGNMKDRRKVWLCVHLHRLKKCESGSIPLFSHPIIGEDSAWPYNEQATSNVEIVGNQPNLFTMKGMTSGNSLGSIARTM